jgi:hypothetical protein
VRNPTTEFQLGVMRDAKKTGCSAIMRSTPFLCGKYAVRICDQNNAAAIRAHCEPRFVNAIEGW